jgi:DNA repair protein RadC
LSTSIKQWAEDDRPREKLALKGAAALSNVELLAILIHNGTKEHSAVELARLLFEAANNDLQKLTSLSVKEILNFQIKGLGPAKAIAIKAALELGVRRELSSHKKHSILKSADVAKFLQVQLQFKKQEVFVVLFLNNANKINHFEIISEGGFTATVADIRVILKKALLHNAIQIILCHNHPSGNLQPSMADKELTLKMKEAANYLDIKLLDHIIVSDEGYFSFADEGFL